MAIHLSSRKGWEQGRMLKENNRIAQSMVAVFVSVFSNIIAGKGIPMLAMNVFQSSIMRSFFLLI
jgi:uncharacterized membrane protein (DUF441 family)